MSHNSKLFFMMCVCLGFHHTASFDRIPASLHLFLSLSFLSVFLLPTYVEMDNGDRPSVGFRAINGLNNMQSSNPSNPSHSVSIFSSAPLCF